MKSDTEKSSHGQSTKLRFTPKPKDSWKKLIGRAKNDELSPEAYRLGAEWRAKMNREGQ
jgi:hypothetical protein